MKQTVSLGPGQSIPVSFQIKPNVEGNYVVQLNGLGKEFTVQAAVGTWTLDATVYGFSHDTHYRLPGATIALNGMAFITGANGRVVVDDIPYGTYFEMVSHPDYMTRIIGPYTVDSPTYKTINPTINPPNIWPKLVQASWDKNVYQPGEQAVLTATYLAPLSYNLLVDVEIIGLGERGHKSPQQSLNLVGGTQGTVSMAVAAPPVPHSYLALTRLSEVGKDPPWDYTGQWAVPNLVVI